MKPHWPSTADAVPPETTHPPSPHFTFQPVSPENVHVLQRLHQIVFPIRYNTRFYADVVHVHPTHLSQLVYDKHECVGAICSRKEPILMPLMTQAEHVSYRVYVMTLAVLAAYRRQKLGSKLLQTLLHSITMHELSVRVVCLHVHVCNHEAMAFYAKHGFQVAARENGYYRNNRGVEPPDAFRLELRW